MGKNQKEKNMKPFVVMMAGLPGSGKSTFAERYVTVNSNKPVVLSTDKLREELYGDPSIQGNYKTLFDEVYRRLRNHLKNGEHVVFDATNIKKEHRKIFFLITLRISNVFPFVS